MRRVLAALGNDESRLARVLGVNAATVYRWKKSTQEKIRCDGIAAWLLPRLSRELEAHKSRRSPVRMQLERVRLNECEFSGPVQLARLIEVVAVEPAPRRRGMIR